MRTVSKEDQQRGVSGSMTRAIFVLTAIAACTPKEDYTPRIDVEPGAAHRACYQSQRAELRGAGPFPDDVSVACAMLLNDVQGPGRPIFYDDTPDAADE